MTGRETQEEGVIWYSIAVVFSIIIIIITSHNNLYVEFINFYHPLNVDCVAAVFYRRIMSHPVCYRLSVLPKCVKTVFCCCFYVLFNRLLAHRRGKTAVCRLALSVVARPLERRRRRRRRCSPKPSSWLPDNRTTWKNKQSRPKIGTSNNTKRRFILGNVDETRISGEI